VSEFSVSSRRKFLGQLAGSFALAALPEWTANAAEQTTRAAPSISAEKDRDPHNAPWFRRAQRWGQTNLTEVDPANFDLAWWREHWRATFLQGVVVNAGGIVAYYPTDVPFHHRAATLGKRDLFGEISRAAQADGLAVFARMDSNRADETLFRAHPDWFARDTEGRPYQLNDLYIACVNGPYYHEHIPAILREVATRYHPEGFTDNNWNGPMRDQPCFCANCQKQFRQRTGEAIPRRADWNSPVYREWIRWNYDRRTEIWRQFNTITRGVGGPTCIWVGMMAGAQSWQSRVFREDRVLYRETELIMLDDQHRVQPEGFQHNGEVGKRIRGVAGWDKIIPESMAMYALDERPFQLTSQTVPEAKMWVLEGFAGGLQPWWHHIGGQQADRRMLSTAAPLWRWQRDHESYLIDREPVASVGLVWSQRNMDFYGRADGKILVDEPWNGWTQALVRARIPYVPVHIDDVGVTTQQIKLLILPAVAAVSDAQVDALRAFVRGGGRLLATGPSTLCHEDGTLREDFALADLFGVHVPEHHFFRNDDERAAWAKDWSQSYLKINRDSLTDEMSRALFSQFDNTDILPFGGNLQAVRIEATAKVPFSFAPAWPTSSVETAYLRPITENIPALVLYQPFGDTSRVAYFPADVDRRYAREYLPDLGNLLANTVRWLIEERLPLRIEGPGLVDAHLYRQENRLVFHLLNLTSAGTWRAPAEELLPLGPYQISIRVPDNFQFEHVRSLSGTNDGKIVEAAINAGFVQFTLPTLLDHQVYVIEAKT
jgi:hypothetical protein